MKKKYFIYLFILFCLLMAESLVSPESWTNSDAHWKCPEFCPEILDTFWEVVKDHRFVVLMQKSSDFFQYNHDSMLFRVSRLFYNLDWEINGKKCTCLMMQSDFIFQKMSRNMAKMKMCELYRHKKFKEYG